MTQPFAPDVIFEDDSIIALCKPAGQAVIAGRGLSEEPLQAQVSRYLGSQAFVVHRLDRDASGLVLFAKDAAAHRKLCSLFEARKIHKKYLAAVLGRVEGPGMVDRPLRAFGSGRTGVADGGKASVTRYKVKEEFSGGTLLLVEPVTGRRHQIRAHLYAVGHPILGDELYGSPRPVGGVARLMLHALELSFAVGRSYRLRAEPPADFARVLEGLRRAR